MPTTGESKGIERSPSTASPHQVVQLGGACLTCIPGGGAWSKTGVLPRLFGYVNVVPLAIGLGLFQIGEFSLVLARMGLEVGGITSDVYALILTTAIVTMVLTPFVSGLTAPLYALRRRWFRYEPVQTMNLPSEGLHGHVVIAGGGRVGQCVAQVLQRLQLRFVLIELDARRVEQAKTAGWPGR